MVRILSFNLTGEIGKNQVLYACGWMLSSMKERQLVQTLEAFSLIFYIFLNIYGWSCFFIAFTNIVLINLKSLKEFAEGVIERGLKIKWAGYARCDERMDLEYLKLLNKSGCFILKIGAESASNNVLSDMSKRMTREIMDKNFSDFNKAGIGVVTTWINGFPTEKTIDHKSTLTFLCRNRNTIVGAASAPGFTIYAENIVGQNPERFGVANFTYDMNWIRDDFSFFTLEITLPDFTRGIACSYAAGSKCL